MCNYCKKTGHTIDQCYKIHGFPDDFKFTKPKRYQKGPVAGNVFSTGEASQQGNSDHAALNSLSPENVSQLLGLLQKMNQKDQAESSANMISSGITKSLESHACLLKIDKCSWILDSGASEHITTDRSFFTNINPFTEPITVTLPNSHKVRVTHTGSVQLFSDLILENVLYIPFFKFNLISIHKLCRQLQKSILFSPNSCLILQGPSVKSP